MCATCGCDGAEHHDHEHGPGAHHHDQDHEHDHPHPHSHHHQHRDGGGAPHGEVTRTLRLEHALLAKNQRHAEANRRRLDAARIFAIDVLGGPGAGKTALLERYLRDRPAGAAVSVIEGDLATANDAERIRAAGAPVVQINTGAVCHLDAHMMGHALDELAPPADSTLFVENVGNLVCPAMFDLGAHERLVVFSITEGEDKPLKYPHMFAAATVVVLSKLDLAPHLDADPDRAAACVREVNPHAPVLRLSARTGHGMDELRAWIASRAAAPRGGS